jgi:hypothetical protein
MLCLAFHRAVPLNPFSSASGDEGFGATMPVGGDGDGAVDADPGNNADDNISADDAANAPPPVPPTTPDTEDGPGALVGWGPSDAGPPPNPPQEDPGAPDPSAPGAPDGTPNAPSPGTDGGSPDVISAIANLFSGVGSGLSAFGSALVGTNYSDPFMAGASSNATVAAIEAAYAAGQPLSDEDVDYLSQVGAISPSTMQSTSPGMVVGDDSTTQDLAGGPPAAFTPASPGLIPITRFNSETLEAVPLDAPTGGIYPGGGPEPTLSEGGETIDGVVVDSPSNLVFMTPQGSRITVFSDGSAVEWDPNGMVVMNRFDSWADVPKEGLVAVSVPTSAGQTAAGNTIVSVGGSSSDPIGMALGISRPTASVQAIGIDPQTGEIVEQFSSTQAASDQASRFAGPGAADTDPYYKLREGVSGGKPVFYFVEASATDEGAARASEFMAAGGVQEIVLDFVQPDGTRIVGEGLHTLGPANQFFNDVNLGIGGDDPPIPTFSSRLTLLLGFDSKGAAAMSRWRIVRP